MLRSVDVHLKYTIKMKANVILQVEQVIYQKAAAFPSFISVAAIVAGSHWGWSNRALAMGPATKKYSDTLYLIPKWYDAVELSGLSAPDDLLGKCSYFNFPSRPAQFQASSPLPYVQ